MNTYPKDLCNLIASYAVIQVPYYIHLERCFTSHSKPFFFNHPKFGDLCILLNYYTIEILHPKNNWSCIRIFVNDRWREKSLSEMTIWNSKLLFTDCVDHNIQILDTSNDEINEWQFETPFDLTSLVGEFKNNKIIIVENQCFLQTGSIIHCFMLRLDMNSKCLFTNIGAEHLLNVIFDIKGDKISNSLLISVWLNEVHKIYISPDNTIVHTILADPVAIHFQKNSSYVKQFNNLEFAFCKNNSVYSLIDISRGYFLSFTVHDNWMFICGYGVLFAIPLDFVSFLEEIRHK